VPAAGRPSPLILSGWTFEAGAREYDGLMHHPQAGTRAAVAGLTAGRTDLVSDNRPPVVDERDAAGVAAVSGSAAAEAPSGGSLVVKLSLAGRSSHETSFVLGLSRADEPTTVLLGRTGPDGVSEPITLPPLADGVYTVTLRAPGFAAARALGVEYGPGPTDVALDLSGGGRTPLRGGELTRDDAVDGADVRAWVVAWLLGRAKADVDGNGRAELGDLWLVWGNRGTGAARGG
jgi:hypothetical protein